MDERPEREGNPPHIVSELITHLNELESKVVALDETISDMNDLQVVNKLDIINLKNELERIRLSVPMLSGEQIGKVEELLKFLQTSSVKDLKEIAKRVSQVQKEQEQLKGKVSLLEIPPVPEGLVHEVEELRAAMESMSPGQSQRSELARLQAEVRKLQSKGLEPSLASLERDVATLKKSPAIQGLERRLAALERAPGRSAAAPDLERRLLALERAAPVRGKPIPAAADLEFRLAALEKSRAPPSRTEPARLGALAADVQEIKKKISSFRVGGKEKKATLWEETSRLHDLEEKVAGLEQGLKELPKPKGSEGAPQNALRAQAERTEQLENALRDLAREIRTTQEQTLKLIERGKKEAVSTVVSELKRMVTA